MMANVGLYIKLFFIAVFVLLINYYLAYGASVNYPSLLYNFIKLSIYFVAGYIFGQHNIRNFLALALLSISIFFIEHVLFRVLHLVLVSREYAINDAMEMLIGSFLFFIPFIILLLYLVKITRKHVEGRKNVTAR